MTLTSKIISSAYREGNLIMRGATPSSDQVAEGLEKLQTIVSASYGYEVGRQLVDWPVGQEGVTTQDQTYWSDDLWSYPPSNMRLIAASITPQTVYLPPQPSDGARMAVIDPAARLSLANLTIDGNGRTIEGAASQILTTSSINKIWFYRADLGDWVLLSTLTGVDPEEFPFPPEFDEYFITMLAMRLNPRYGRALHQSTADALTATLSKLRARYKPRVVVGGDPGKAALTGGYGAFRGGFVNGDTGMTRRARNVIRPPHYEG